MRIIGGKFKGRNIITPKGRTTRPTSDQTRESIFNILTHADWAKNLQGALIADIFAGSGALGLEALSRGGRFCLFVETEPKARAAIRENILNFGLGGCTRLHRRDATKLRIEPGNLKGAFDFVFLDPPYGRNMGMPVIKKLQLQNLIYKNTIIIYEMSKDEEFGLEGFNLLSERIWGNSKIIFTGIKSD